MSIAIVPGSFDPMTLGHLDIVKIAAERYDKVYVAIMINNAKQYMFDMAYRAEIAKITVRSIPNVEVIVEKGLLVDLFDKLNADTVCKGWRDQKDYEYELKLADWNSEHNKRFRTELIAAKGPHMEFSSTKVRELINKGKSALRYMDPKAWLFVKDLIDKKKSKENQSSKADNNLN